MGYQKRLNLEITKQNRAKKGDKMNIKTRTVGITLTKRVQEEEFEPFEIQVSDSVTVTDPSKKEIIKLRKQMYNRLEKELDGLIAKRLASLEDDE